jgi:ABC-type polysaccharide/polyol phosphate export permease
MAELHVKRKRSSLGWLWILIVLIIAAVIYYLYTNNYFNSGNPTGMKKNVAVTKLLC